MCNILVFHSINKDILVGVDESKNLFALTFHGSSIDTHHFTLRRRVRRCTATARTLPENHDSSDTRRNLQMRRVGDHFGLK